MNRPMNLLVIALAALLLVPAAASAQGKDKPKQPKLGPPPTLKVAPVQHFKLSNGLAVSLIEKHDVPLVQIELVVRAGTAMDPAGKNGLASMTAAMLEEGAGGRNALEFADACDFLGASLNAYASQHTSGAVLHTPLSKLDSALALLADMALRPAFPAEELQRNRMERLTTLAQQHDQPRAIASVLTSKTLYGTDHPYGRPGIGNEAGLRSISVDDLRAFHAAWYQPNNGFIVVSGDVKGADIVAKLERLFGAWPRGAAAPPTVPTAPQVAERRIYLADKPGAAQSEIRVGCIGVARLTEDYFPLLVMNTILGGAFTSRLNQNLREEHGYSYGAGSMFDFRPTPGPFLAYAAVQTNVTDSAVIEFMKEIRGILKPVPDEELTRAKNNLALSYPRDFGSVAQVTGQLAELATYGLPDETFNTYIQKVLSVTKDDVQRVAKKYLNPDRVAIIVVGDRAVIEKGLEATKIAPITNLTVDQVLGPAPVLDGK